MEEKEKGIPLGELIEKVDLVDVHLVHHEVDIELATIVELNANTLTGEGKKEWSDVLNAKIIKIFYGFYGNQLVCADIAPERLSAFSYMLAGNCAAKDFKKWVNNEETADLKMD